MQAQTFKTSGQNIAASVEAAYPFAMAHGFSVEPQAQVVYQHLSLDGGADAFGRIDFADSDTLYGRLSAWVSGDWRTDDGRRMSVWARASLWSSFGAVSKTTFTTLDGTEPTTLQSDMGGSWAQFDLCVNGKVSRHVFNVPDRRLHHGAGQRRRPQLGRARRIRCNLEGDVVTSQ